MDPAYPETPREPVQDELWGETLVDCYRWLEEEGSERTRRWLDAQDAYATEILGQLPDRREYVDRLGELLRVDAWSAPRRRGDRYFFTRRHIDREKTIHYWRPVGQEEDRVLLDPNTMSADGTVSVGVVEPSPDGRLVAWSRKKNNADESTLVVRDVQTGEDRAEEIEGAKYAWPSWSADSSGFYYTWLPPDEEVPVADRPGTAEIRYHAIGTDPADDPLVFPSTGDPRTFIGAEVSHCGRWLFVSVYQGWNASDVYIRDLHDGTGEFQPFFTDLDAMALLIGARGDDIFVRTNLDAPRFRICRARPGSRDPDEWEDLVPERDSAVIERAELCRDSLVVVTLENAHAGLEVHPLDGTPCRDVELPAMGSISSLVGHPDHATYFFAFESFVDPPRIIEGRVDDAATSDWAAVELDIDTTNLTVTQHWFRSSDGTRVSMFVVRPDSASTPGKLLLYGYGGFMRSMLPEFRASIFPWLEQGGSYAVVNLRGGGEYGEDWHRAGMRESKQQSFDDFFCAAEHLIEQGLTSPDKLAAYGGSNGGLLMGAALTQRPDLFAAIVCAVPLLDMVRYHLFGSGKTWISEYGSVEESEEMFRAIHGYSPYHHIEADQQYPPVLFQSADSDDRVDPMHARKMAAALQAVSSNPVLLKLERNAGHGGSDRVSATVERLADLYTFISHELNGDG